MNLTELMKDGDRLTDYYVTRSKQVCYYCDKPGEFEDYDGLQRYNQRSEQSITDDIVVVDYYKPFQWRNEYIVITTDSVGTYHCASCINKPVEVSQEQLGQYSAWILEAKRLVEADLGVRFEVKLFNKLAAESGFVNPNKPSIVNINIGRLLGGYNGCAQHKLAAAVAHEARHIWQFHTGFEFDSGNTEYLERAEEIDAFAYQDAFMEKHYGVIERFAV